MSTPARRSPTRSPLGWPQLKELERLYTAATGVSRVQQRKAMGIHIRTGDGGHRHESVPWRIVYLYCDYWKLPRSAILGEWPTVIALAARAFRAATS